MTDRVLANVGGSRVEHTLVFDAVYDEYFDYVYRLIARFADPEEVQDLVQEVFVVVHRRLDEFEGRAKMSTWLFRICYRVVGRHLRTRRLRRRLAELLRFEPHEPATLPSLGLEQSVEMRRVRQALATLSYQHRTALVMHEVEGWSGDRLAEALGVPVSTVYSRLHYARKKFRQAYQRLCRREEP